MNDRAAQFAAPRRVARLIRNPLVIAGLLIASTGLMRWPDETAAAEEERPQNYSPYANRTYATHVYWGDQHLHTSYSPDAGLVGDRHGPDDAFRFARGEQLRSSSGQLVQLERPYDWMVVSDHATYFGLPQAFMEMDPDILKTESGKKWAEALKKGGKEGYEAFVEMTKDFAEGKGSIPREALVKLYRSIWHRAIEAAERNNKPGKFTAFNGFEWTQSIKGTTSTGSWSSATAQTGPSRSSPSRSSTAPTSRTCGSTWPTTRRRPAAA